MADNENTVRQALEKTARRFHQERQYNNSQEHKWWKFENCPADYCKEARQALGMPEGVMPPIHDTPAPAIPAPREPGEEG
jgi:hypothetical protein